MTFLGRPITFLGLPSVTPNIHGSISEGGSSWAISHQGSPSACKTAYPSFLSAISPRRSTAGLDHDILRVTKTGVIKWAQWEVLPGARPSILWSPTLWRQTLGKGSLPPAPGIPLEMCRRINKMCVGEHKHICALLKIRCQKFHKLASVFFFSLHRIVCQCFSLKIILVTTYLLDT